MPTAVHVVIHGRVQGVWYRGWAVGKAEALGLDGWVRNRRDGTVEAVFSGDPVAVERMIEACREGPPAARVSAIDRRPVDPLPAGAGFAQRATP